MSLIWIARWVETPGPSLSINCPRCGEQAVTGRSYERLETLLLFGVVPVAKFKNTFVQCRGCKAKLTSRLNIGELTKYQGAGISQFLSDDVSFVFKFLAIVSLLLFFAPIVGLVLAAITFVGTFKSRTWPRTLALVSLILSSIVNAVIVIGLIVFK